MATEVNVTLSRARSLALRTCIDIGDAGEENSAREYFPPHDSHGTQVQGTDWFAVEVEGPKAFKAISDALKLENDAISVYDTAWVARIPDPNPKAKGGRPGPRFPEAVEWIFQNQLPDGSWGEEQPVSPFDQTFATLACVVSLKTWDTASECVAKGEQFVQESLLSMKDDDLSYVSLGMTNAFCALLDEAEKLGLTLVSMTSPCHVRPKDFSALLEEAEKLGVAISTTSTVPKPSSASFVENLRSIHHQILERWREEDFVTHCPRKLLNFPEGLQEVVDWEGLRQLQSEDGSIFSSPAATACFVIKTGDTKALDYFSSLVRDERFNNAVPSVYPNPVSGVLNLVDHLERLNIDRFFSKEIKDVLDTLHTKIRADGNDSDIIISGDLETRAMIFRVLREHGYEVSPENISLEGNVQLELLGPRGVLQLYRASELIFPGEFNLDHIKEITRTYLKSLLADEGYNQHDCLKREIEEALHSPHFMRFRALESMKYIDRFGRDVEAPETYLETTFTRFMHEVNPQLVALAKENFNACQSIYQQELLTLMRWDEEHLRQHFNFQRQPLRMLPAFLAGVVGIPNPELVLARSVWTRGSVLVTVIDDLFDEAAQHDGIQGLRLFHESIKRWDSSIVETCCESVKVLAKVLMNEVDSLCKDASSAQGRDLTPFLRALWQDVVAEFLTEAEWTDSGYQPNSEEYLRTGAISFGLGPITLYTIFCYGELIPDELVKNEDFLEAFDLVNQYGRLINDVRTHSREVLGGLGQHSYISVYQREHPKFTRQEANSNIQNLLKALASKVFSKLLNPTYTSQAVRQAHLVMMRSLYLMYYEVDGYRFTTSELKKQIQRFFNSPFQLD